MLLRSPDEGQLMYNVHVCVQYMEIQIVQVSNRDTILAGLPHLKRASVYILE